MKDVEYLDGGGAEAVEDNGWRTVAVLLVVAAMVVVVVVERTGDITGAEEDSRRRVNQAWE